MTLRVGRGYNYKITKIMEVNVNDFIPYEKLSKKKKRELDNARRSTWGALNPVTRRPVSPKAYNRSKARKQNYDDSSPVLYFLSTLIYSALFCRCAIAAAM